MIIRMCCFFLFLVTTHMTIAEQSVDEIHEELRTLLKGIETTVNEKRYADLPQYFHKNLKVTTVNQNTIHTHKEISEYFSEWFGQGGYLQSLQMSLNADKLTDLYNRNTIGVVQGSGVEYYELTDGRVLDLDTRWTATTIKDLDGKWRVLSLHIGTNFYDNPIYHESRRFLIKLGVLGTVLGVILGALLARIFFSKKAT